MTGSVRASFVARFGEADAVAIEAAAEQHLSNAFDIHAGDQRGADPFKYALLTAIGYECVTRFRRNHGIVAEAADIQAWAIAEADLGSHDGDIPDYISAIAGVYGDWIKPSAEVDA